MASTNKRSKVAYDLALVYLNGRRVRKNAVKGMAYLVLAASQAQDAAEAKAELVNSLKRDIGTEAFAEVAYAVALKYLRGDGVPQSVSKAVEMFTFAASAGHVQSKFELGMHHWVGVPSNHKEAVRLVREAAEHGLAGAQHRMAVWSLNKHGLNLGDADFKISIPDAIRYYTSAAEQGLPDVQFELANLYSEGKVVPQDVPKAIELLTRSADAGYAAAQYRLGVSFDRTAQNGTEALRYLNMASSQNYALAHVQLGLYLLKGKYVSKDPEAAVRLFQRASDQKCPKAMLCLGVCHQTGEGVPLDLAKATCYFCLAGRLGNAEAQNNAGLSVLFGLGTDTNECKGYELLRQSAEAGCPEAQTNLGVCHLRGVPGVPANDEQALRWWRRAVKRNFWQAQSNLDIYDFVHGTKHSQTSCKAAHTSGIVSPSSLRRVLSW